MAILQMRRIYIAGLKNNKQKIVEYLQRQGAVELIESVGQNSNVFSLTNNSETVKNLEIDYDTVLQAKNILNQYIPEKTSIFAGLEGREIKSVEEYESFHSGYQAVLDSVNNIYESQKKKDKVADEIVQLKETKESLKPWEDFEHPLNYSGTKNTVTKIGTIPYEYNNEDLKQALSEMEEASDKFVIEIISSSKEQTCILAIALKEDEKDLEEALNKLQFAPPVTLTSKPPAEEILAIENKIDEKELLEASYVVNIKAQEIYRKDYNFLLDYLAILIDNQNAFSNISESGYTFVLEGYILARDSENIKQKLIKDYDCAVNIVEIEDTDSAPALMKDSWFTEPVESVVASYSYPKVTDIDPTSITSIFYYFMFGIMFSDAGYGTILALGCAILLLKFKNMEPATSKLLRLFFWCGISTIFWGVVFSSYFGDVVGVVSQNFFGKYITIPPLWFSPLQNPMKLLLFCLAIGIIHLTTGYMMNAYTLIRNKDPLGAVYDAFMPVLFLFSLLVIFVSTTMFEGLSGFRLNLSDSTKTICLALAAISTVVIVLTNGRESKSWFKRLLKGAFGMYNIAAGWLSDILSYSRLLALGLATGVIASVINTLGAMAGRGFVGAILFIIIFAIGHTMNFGINILGSYVHSNRLEYVEFFGKFYEGGGREFKPLKINTKYYNIKEEN